MSGSSLISIITVKSRLRNQEVFEILSNYKEFGVSLRDDPIDAPERVNIVCPDCRPAEHFKFQVTVFRRDADPVRQNEREGIPKRRARMEEEK